MLTKVNCIIFDPVSVATNVGCQPMEYIMKISTVKDRELQQKLPTLKLRQIFTFNILAAILDVSHYQQLQISKLNIEYEAQKREILHVKRDTAYKII